MLWSFEGIFGFMCIGTTFVHTSLFHTDPKINSSSRWKWTLIEISQNVTTPFTISYDLWSFVIRFGNIVIAKPNFNDFGHSHNYDATIKNFILLVGILHLFSSINRLICPISRNSHQITCILKVFYIDIEVYFNVCIKIIYIYNMHTYVYYLYNEYQN